jgi:glycosyltransferase involved in cell wall biosynthesis
MVAANMLRNGDRRPVLAQVSKPRILFPVHGLYQNGGGFATLGIADHLQSTGKYRISVLSYDGTHWAMPRSGLDLVLPSLRGLRYLPKPAQPIYRNWRRASALARAVGAADLVVASDPRGPTLVEAARLARKAGKPVAGLVHIDLPSHFASEDFQSDWTMAQTLAEYRRLDRIICVSQGIRDSLAAAVPEKAGDIVAIRNGVDLARLDRLAAEAPDGPPLPEAPFFLGVGRLDHAKGFDLLIAAHARLLDQGAPPHALVILGKGRLLDRLEAQAAALGVAESVQFRGFAANPFPVMARAAALVTSSRFEGYPLTTTEGAALGVPVIATDCPHGPTEILEGGRYGALIPPEDVESLASAIHAHLADPGALTAKAAASRLDRERLSVRGSHRQYEAVFDALIRQRPGTGGAGTAQPMVAAD